MPGHTDHTLLPKSRVYLVYVVVPVLLWLDAREGPEVETWIERLLSKSNALKIFASTVFKPILVGLFLSFIGWLASWHSYALLFPLCQIHLRVNRQLLVPLIAALLIAFTVLGISLDVPMGTHKVLRNWSPIRVLVDFEELYRTTLITCGYMHCISMTAQIIVLTYCGGLYTPDSWTLDGTEEPRTATVPLIRVVSGKQLLQEVKAGEARSVIIDEDDDESDQSTSFIEEDELAEKPWGSVMHVDADDLIEADVEEV
ncbi:uncharacterized protein BDZ99DRAFT_518909 [Mytilinidion resinicola]|uniref:Uncharacterized protein n=1 Tax=Mytilinidion resinicola TaxID=574789 RepID=A0A6A6YRU0_9PEZI|nr:uncharacterized protein BDZ99DRAFT_518909 [Mytilinidion resinicola]KAF2811656.1 hypothetical protein BDZ99DRAFT_518909 [Mytilinidion resinicola]